MTFRNTQVLWSTRHNTQWKGQKVMDMSISESSGRTGMAPGRWWHLSTSLKSTPEGHTKRWCSREEHKMQYSWDKKKQTSFSKARMDRAAQTRTRVVGEEAKETPRHHITQGLLYAFLTTGSHWMVFRKRVMWADWHFNWTTVDCVGEVTLWCKKEHHSKASAESW